MTLNQRFATIFVAGMLMGISFCNAFGESRPANVAGQRLQIELDAYVQKFTLATNLGPEYMQWAVMVLPAMEVDSPAIVYSWGVPHPTQGKHQMWIAIFTFHQSDMLLMSPTQRKVVAAHEVGHLMPGCMGFVLETEGMDPLELAMAQYYYRVLVESCADAVATTLTSVQETIDTLEYVRTLDERDSPVLLRRIQILQQRLTQETETNE